MEKEVGAKYSSSNILFQVIQKEYEYELNRSMKLDNKINITITFCGVILLFIFKNLNFSNIFNATNDYIESSALCFVKNICAFGNIAVFSLFLYSVIRLILLLKAKGYFHFNCDEIFNKQLIFEAQEVSEYYVGAKYWAATCENNKTNEKRSKDYNKAIWSLCVMLILNILTEFIKINFLGLGA